MERRFGRVAAALSGGAAKGLAHIGVLEALIEHGLEPDAIAGTSAGALIGGFYAAGVTTDRMREMVDEFDSFAFRKLIDLTWAKGSLVAGNRVEEFIRNVVGDVRIEDLEIDYVATAVDINSGAGHYFTHGPLVDAIRASISIPGVFQPVAANGGFLVDGGLRRNLPIAVTERFDADTVVAVNITDGPTLDLQWRAGAIERDDPGPKATDIDIWQRIRRRLSGDDDEPEKRDLPGVAFLASQAFAILAADLAQAEIEQADPDLVIEVDMSEIDLWEFWRGPEAANLGYEQSRGLIERFVEGERR